VGWSNHYLESKTLETSYVLTGDYSNSRYVIEDKAEEHTEGDRLHFIIKGFDKNISPRITTKL
jgi:hypothetical protein